MSYNVILLTSASDQSPVLRTLGPARLATSLRSANYTVKVVDFLYHLNIDLGAYLLSIVDKHTLWIGVSTTFLGSLLKKPDGTKGYSLAIEDHLKKVKEQYPSVKIVLGGANSFARNVPLVDIYVDGYADNSAVELTKSLQGKLSSIQYSGNRVSYDVKASSFDFTNKGYTEYLKDDNVQPNEALPLETSRGCIFSCKFCAYPLNGKRKLDFIKDPGVLKTELLTNYENFGTTNYVIVDDTFNDSTAKLESFKAAVDTLPFKLNFGAYCRADLLIAHPKQVSLLRDLGLRSVFFGVESLNAETAAFVGKGAKPYKLLSLFKTLRSEWPETMLGAGFIVGLPKDTETTIRQWLSLLVEDSSLHKTVVSALQLRNDEHKIWKSAIDSDPASYGYSLGGYNSWSNSLTGMTFDKANQLVAEYYKLKPRMVYPGVFDVPVLLSAGIPIQSILDKTWDRSKYSNYTSSLLHSYSEGLTCS